MNEIDALAKLLKSLRQQRETAPVSESEKSENVRRVLAKLRALMAERDKDRPNH